MYCVNCGYKLNFDDNYCASCGIECIKQVQQNKDNLQNELIIDDEVHINKENEIKDPVKKNKKMIPIIVGFVVFIAAVAASLFFIFSYNKIDDSMIGKWVWESGDEIFFFCIFDTIEFFDNKSVVVYNCSFSGESGTYNIKSNNRLIVLGDKDRNSYSNATLEFIYEIIENKLFIEDSDGDVGIFVKIDEND